ncbi:LysR substrate-binding domain-containing protein [Alcaligenes aquatilis]|uniref:LysR substrate-binding domain-containing protein n=1 Tax=Alcaligenes aquatilis TaxID=323284 RepID=A0ABY4NI46_9BURK|nr:LysR substrate-binding domain-containing protein [Alcaligenes aquatilis]UQN36155.1 LysR substrate-binding domain-containing protein [Alcaligenes aquatilis]
MLRQHDLLKGELQDFALGVRGTLHLYANTAALTDFLPPRLAPWLAQRPNLHIELKERTSTDIVRTVAAGLAQAGVVSDAVQAPELVLEPVAKDHLVLIMAAAHPLAALSKLSLQEVLHEPFVGLMPGNALQDHLDEHARAAGHALAQRIRMKTFEGLCQMVAHGVGQGIVPQGVASRYKRRYGFVARPLSDAWANRSLCLCYQDWDALSKPMQRLLQHLGATKPC